MMETMTILQRDSKRPSNISKRRFVENRDGSIIDIHRPSEWFISCCDGIKTTVADLSRAATGCEETVPATNLAVGSIDMSF